MILWEAWLWKSAFLHWNIKSGELTLALIQRIRTALSFCLYWLLICMVLYIGISKGSIQKFNVQGCVCILCSLLILKSYMSAEGQDGLLQLHSVCCMLACTYCKMLKKYYVHLSQCFHLLHFSSVLCSISSLAIWNFDSILGNSLYIMLCIWKPKNNLCLIGSYGMELHALIVNDLYYHLQGELEGRKIPPGSFQRV